MTSPLTNLHWYRHFSIQYEFYASVQIQMIIKTKSVSFSWRNVAWKYTVIFQLLGTRVVLGSKKYPGNKLPGYPAALPTISPLWQRSNQPKTAVYRVRYSVEPLDRPVSEIVGLSVSFQLTDRLGECSHRMQCIALQHHVACRIIFTAACHTTEEPVGHNPHVHSQICI